MSPIFMDCVKQAASTKDLLIRKMVYLYISNYARRYENLRIEARNQDIKGHSASCLREDRSAQKLTCPGFLLAATPRPRY